MAGLRKRATATYGVAALALMVYPRGVLLAREGGGLAFTGLHSPPPLAVI